jgi:hypothetical protein
MNGTAEAGQPKYNKHAPNAYGPTLQGRRDYELLMLLRMTLPTPKTVIRPSSARRNLLLRFLCDYGQGRVPNGVDNRSRQTEEEHCEVEGILMLCSGLGNESREDRRQNGKKTYL